MSTWTTAAVDKRVVAIVPIVIDMLNIVPSFKHHFAAYGFWAPAVGDIERMTNGRKSCVYLSRGRCENVLHIESGIVRHLQFAADVDLGVRPIAHEHNGEPGRTAGSFGKGRHARRHLGAHLRRNRGAVNDPC